MCCLLETCVTLSQLMVWMVAVIQTVKSKPRAVQHRAGLHYHRQSDIFLFIISTDWSGTPLRFLDPRYEIQLSTPVGLFSPKGAGYKSLAKTSSCQDNVKRSVKYMNFITESFRAANCFILIWHCIIRWLETTLYYCAWDTHFRLSQIWGGWLVDRNSLCYMKNYFIEC